MSYKMPIFVDNYHHSLFIREKGESRQRQEKRYDDKNNDNNTDAVGTDGHELR